MNENQRKEFEELTRPVIEWMNNNCNPHVVIVIEPTSATLNEGLVGFYTEDYVKD
jgi:hypothetical protein